MKFTPFHLERRSVEEIRENGAEECIFRAVPCCGVFRSEEDFIDYLRRYEAPNHGACAYLGIKGEKELKLHEMIEVYPMNYEVINNESPPKEKTITGHDLEPGLAAIVISDGPHKGHLVIKSSSGHLQSISDPKVYWKDNSRHVEVRLLAPGEERIIRGR